MTFNRKIETREKILNAALKAWPDTTSRGVAKFTDLSHITVFHYYGDTLKDIVPAYALEVEDCDVIVKLIADKHPSVDHLTTEEKLSYIDDWLK